MTHTLAPPITAVDLRNCMTGSGPQMRYQPIVHLEANVAIGAEAFSRFPSGSPLDWFTAAEEFSLGRALECRVVENILSARSAWPSAWEMVCVNVSPERLADPAMRQLLAGAHGGRLVVELTDQTALPSEVLLRRQLEELRNQGVRIAVSGVRPTKSGQERVLRIQPEVVKLDVATLSSIDDDTAAQHDVADLVARCRRSGIFVVAVGVETIAQRTMVGSLGVEAVQGHLYGLPTDIDGVVAAGSQLSSNTAEQAS